jgi:hypothetical protein
MKKEIALIGIFFTLIFIIGLTGCTEQKNNEDEWNLNELILGTWKSDPTDWRNNKSHTLYQATTINFFSDKNFTSNTNLKGQYSIESIGEDNFLKLMIQPSNERLYFRIVMFNSGGNPDDPSTFIKSMYITEPNSESTITYFKEK